MNDEPLAEFQLAFEDFHARAGLTQFQFAST